MIDDEGQPAQRVELVDKGVLKTFLMSRLPVASFAESNGHGRAETPLELDSVADWPRIGDLAPAEARAGVLGANWLRFLRAALPAD